MRASCGDVLLAGRMIQTICRLHHPNTHLKQVGSLFFLFRLKSYSTLEYTNNNQILNSPIHISGFTKSVISRCSHYWDSKIKADTFTNPSLKDFIVPLSNFSPQTVRRFWRVSELRPQDVLELLLGFEFHSGKLEIEVEKVGCLWGMFKWASGQSEDFKHLPRSWKIMGSMLVRVGLVQDVEFLLSDMENEGILLDDHEIFSYLIEWYVGCCDLERAIAMYGRMRGVKLLPSLSCYGVLLDYLVQVSESQLAVHVYGDVLEMGLGMGIAGKGMYENVVQLLCRVGKVQEARNVIKKASAFGLKPTDLLLDSIAGGYCEKKDYDDLLSFFAEVKSPPSVVIGNKIIFSLCKDFGAEEAFVFMQELEHSGYCPDEITYGILIGWSCRKGKLKKAFIYISEMLSRGLKPHIYSYNALISGMFKEGMWKQARDILHEMDDSGITPDMSTFKVLLAGYCRTKKIDKVKVMIADMVERGLIQLASVEDPLSKAFMILGLDLLAVKVKRDNDVGFSKTEFYDDMGNGLYLETDEVKYEETMSRVLDDSMVPDYNFILIDGGRKSFRTALRIIDEMIHWGQELSLTSFSTLLNGFHASNFSIKATMKILKKMPRLHNQLDEETLNLIVLAHIKKGFTHKARIVADEMVRKSQQIKHETYTALIASLCMKGNSRDLHDCWKLATYVNWFPGLEDYKTLIGCLCQKKILKEALELFEKVVLAYPHYALQIYHTTFEKLSGNGFTGIAHILAEELLKRNAVLDSTTYSLLVRGYCREKRFLEAFVVTNMMLDKDMVPEFDVSISVLPPLCWHGYIDQAIFLKEIVSRQQPWISLSISCALLSGYCNKGMVERAASLLQEMILNGNSLNNEVYNNLIQGYCRMKDLKKAGEVLGGVIRKNFSISLLSYRKLVSLMCTEGRIHFASSLKTLVDKDTNISNLIVYNILIFYLFSSGNSAYVDTVLDEIKENKLEPDTFTYNFLVYGFSRCKAVPRSLQHLSDMMCKELRPSNRCLRSVIKSLYYDGQLGMALKWSQEMESRGWVHCSTVQNCIVQGLLNNGEVQEAVTFLDRMSERGLIPGNINYDNLIKLLCSYGRHNKAVDLIDIMLKKGNIPNPSSYECMILGFSTCHKLEEALDFLYEMLGRNLMPSISTCSLLVDKFCEAGKTAEAEMLINCLVQMGEVPTRKMFCSVVSRYRSENNTTKASEILRVMQQYGYEPDFETHWSLISNLSKSSDSDKSNKGRSFLSTLLSKSGFGWRKDHKVKPG